MVTGLTTMPDSNFLTCWMCCGLQLGLKVLMDHADAARLRHGDGQRPFGDGIHRGGDDRNVQPYAFCEVRGDVHLGRQHIRKPRLQKHIVEGKPRLLPDDGHFEFPLARDRARLRWIVVGFNTPFPICKMWLGRYPVQPWPSAGPKTSGANSQALLQLFALWQAAGVAAVKPNLGISEWNYSN